MPVLSKDRVAVRAAATVFRKDENEAIRTVIHFAAQHVLATGGGKRCENRPGLADPAAPVNQREAIVKAYPDEFLSAPAKQAHPEV